MGFFKFFRKKEVQKDPVKLNVKRRHLLIETLAGDKYTRVLIGIDNGPTPGSKGKMHNVYTVDKQTIDLLCDFQGISVPNPQDLKSMLWIPFSSVKHITIAPAEDYYIDVE